LSAIRRPSGTLLRELFSQSKRLWRVLLVAALLVAIGSFFSKRPDTERDPVAQAMEEHAEQWFKTEKTLGTLASDLKGAKVKDAGGSAAYILITLQSGERYYVNVRAQHQFAAKLLTDALLAAPYHLVNISDDAWYGDTSAPWQHLNMVRMRAIENRRWLIRATNNGVTAAIDPYGRVRQSIPRHVADSLPAQYGFRDDVTFYSNHGDIFAWLCVMASVAILLGSAKKRIKQLADDTSDLKTIQWR